MPEYTLTGFDEFFEGRRVSFVGHFPPIRVCSVCGVVPSRSMLLPCRHVVCYACRARVTSRSLWMPPGGRTSHGCPLDGSTFTRSSVTWLQLQPSELERCRVYCLNGVGRCDFVGRFADLKEHFFACLSAEVECAACNQRFCRRDAVAHCRHCSGASKKSTTGNVEGFQNAFERLAGIREELRELQERSTASVDRDAVVGSTNSIMVKLARLQAELELVKVKANSNDSVEHVDRSSPMAVQKAPVAHGPFRAASEVGGFVTTYAFHEVYSTRAVLRSLRYHSQMSDAYTVGGYTFKTALEFFKEQDAELALTFRLHLVDGVWNDCVAWPFDKKVAIVLAHPTKEDRDLRFSVPMNDSDMIKKPAPDARNVGARTAKKVPWRKIEEDGFIHSGTLYVAVEIV